MGLAADVIWLFYLWKRWLFVVLALDVFSIFWSPKEGRIVACNKLQFQGDTGLSEFIKRYGTEQQCYEALAQWRWLNGFRCPGCGHDQYYQLSYRQLRQCIRCRRQCSVTAGTLFQRGKLPLATWFKAIHLVIHNIDISLEELHVYLGISRSATRRMKKIIINAISRPGPAGPITLEWGDFIVVELKDAPNHLILSWFDSSTDSGLTTNGISKLPVALSQPKDLIRGH